MTLIRLFSTISLGLLFLISSGCEQPTAPQSTDTSAMHESLRPKLSNTVAAVAYPLQYLTERIAGKHVQVEFPVGREPSQPNWQPSAEAITVLQNADLVITNGSGAQYADWLARVSLSPNKLVKSCTNLASSDFVIVKDHKIVHQHGPEGEHSHPYMVAYSWLDPNIAEKQAKQILARLSETYPKHKDDFQANFDSLRTDLSRLRSLLEQPEKTSNTNVLAISPHFKFLTRAAKIDDQHLLWFESEKATNGKEEDTVPRKVEFTTRLESVRKLAPDSAVVLLVPSTGDFGLKESLGNDFEKAFELKVVYLDTLDQKPANGDYLTVMKDNIERLQNSAQ